MLARATRAVLGFGLVTSLSVHALATIMSSLRGDFFASNIMASPDRTRLILIALGGFALAFAWGAALIAKDPTRGVPALEWWVRLMCPVVVAPVLIAVLHQRFGSEVETALVLTLTVIGFERLMRISLKAWHERLLAPPPLVPSLLSRAVGAVKAAVLGAVRSPSITFVMVIVLAAGQATFLATWAVWSHQRFGTFGFDLGQYDNVFACTLHGRWLAMPAIGLPGNWGDLTSNHADLGVFVLLPIYALRPGATTLIVLQSIFVAAGAVPLYLFARNRLPVAAAFAVAIAWLAYAPMHEAQLYDYHPQLIAATLVLCAIAAVEYRRWVVYWVFFTLAILIREDVSIGLSSLGLYLALSGHRTKTGVATVGLAVAYFIGLRFFLMTNTSFAGIYKDLQAPDEGPGFGSILKTIISNPAFVLKSLLTWEKVRYVAQIFAPLAFIPMRRPLLWLLMIPGFFLTLLSTQYLPTVQISFQYVANWAAYLFPALVIALSEYAPLAEGTVKRRAALLALMCGTLVASVQWGAYSPRGAMHGGFADVAFIRPSPADVQREVDLRALLERVPRHVALCTSDRVQPHTTDVHLENWALKSGAQHCEYLMWSNVPGDLGAEYGHQALANGTFELVEQKPGVTLAKRKAAPPK